MQFVIILLRKFTSRENKISFNHDILTKIKITVTDYNNLTYLYDS